MKLFHYMKKKIYLFVAFLLLFQLLSVPFLYVEAWNEEQPKTCAWPSEMMSNYFDFQSEMKKVILSTDLNAERFSVTFGSWWLFTNRVLDFNSTSAIELVSSRVIWNIRSFVSNSITSLFLLALAEGSVLQSNTEGFAMLFADWPIVRDYKTMLDIETDLFDIAYYSSKEIDLTQTIDSKMERELKNVIKKYRDKWLLSGNDGDIRWSLKDIILDLNNMNVAMKQFIMVGGKSIGNAWLYDYRWCLWNVKADQCTDKIAILMFSTGAIGKLSDDYKDVRKFWKCSTSVSHFKATLKKTIKNNSDALSDAMQDVRDALNRLGTVLVEQKPSGPYDPCKSLSAYELAQLQAYWWWTWECWFWIDFSRVEKYINDKIAYAKQKKKESDKLRYSVNSLWDKNSEDKLRRARTYQERANYYASQLNDRNFSKYYNFELDEGFLMEMNLTMDEYLQSQENAYSTDIISLFWKIRWVLDQIDEVISNSNNLKKELKGVEGKQCSS